MKISADRQISMAEAARDFSRVARLADETGSAMIVQDGAPRYLVIDLQQAGAVRELPDEDLLSISERFLRRNRTAYEELAK